MTKTPRDLRTKYYSLLEKKVDEIKPDNPGLETATFAAGCFWGVELFFQRIPGIESTKVGYTAGEQVNPTYQEVCRGTTGHSEAVQIKFLPTEVSYRDLVDAFYEVHDPTQLNRQQNDRGTQYRSGIYYHSESQKKDAEEATEAAQKAWAATGKIVTEIKEATEFYDAEDYHQKYLENGGQCAMKGDKTAIRCYG